LAAVVLGVVHSGVQRSRLRASEPPVTHTEHAAGQRSLRRRQTGKDFTYRAPVFGVALAPAAGRLQQYDAFMRLRVDSQDELSQSTQDALRFTRQVGGFVVWARYGAPGKRGDSELALRVPIGKVQTAIAHFAGYGSLVGQRIVLKDLQRRADSLAARIRAVEVDLAGAIRQGLAQRAGEDRVRLAALRAERKATARRGQLARIALTMVAQ